MRGPVSCGSAVAGQKLSVKQRKCNKMYKPMSSADEHKLICLLLLAEEPVSKISGSRGAATVLTSTRRREIKGRLLAPSIAHLHCDYQDERHVPQVSARCRWKESCKSASDKFNTVSGRFSTSSWSHGQLRAKAGRSDCCRRMFIQGLPGHVQSLCGCRSLPSG